MTKLDILIIQLEKAVSRLDEVLAQPKTEIIRDSAIQRFEFSLDLSWKAIKARLEEEKGVICTSPKDCFKEAYHQGFIDYDQAWLDLVDARNQTVHTYNEEIAEEIFAKLPKAKELFEKLLVFLRVEKK